MKGGTPGSPWSWNKYLYVGGDPVNFKDRHGLNRSAEDEDGDEGYDDQPFIPSPGGGGSGNGGDGSYLTYKVPGNRLVVNPANSRTLNGTITALEQNLDEQCISWLTTSPYAPDATHLYNWMESERSQVGVAQFEDAKTGYFVADPVAQDNVGVPGFNILVNTVSIAFQGSGAGGYGNLNKNTDAIRAFVLIHEFAHELGIPGFYPEGNGDDNVLKQQEAKNNQQIFDHCGGTLAKFKN